MTRPPRYLRTPDEPAPSLSHRGGEALESVERALAASERRFRRLVETAHVGVWAIDATGHTTYVNSHMAAMLGCDLESLRGKLVYDCMTSDAAFAARTFFARRQRGLSDVHEFEFLKANGDVLPALVSASPLYNDFGDFDGELAMVTDITIQRMSTEALRASEQRARLQFSKLPVPTFLWEKSGDDFVLLEFNDAAEVAFTGFIGSPIGHLASELFPKHPDVLNACRVTLSEGIVSRLDAEIIRAATGERRSYQITVGPQPPDRVILHAVDTTERIQLEQHLRYSQKMEAVGRLAGGIAHDFNNLLTVIGVRSTFLLEGFEPGDARVEDVQEINAAGLRAALLTRQLLAFSRKQIMRPSLINLNDVVRDAETLLRRVLSDEVVVTAHLDPGTGHVMADSSQIEQVLINLAMNARDAMPDGGSIVIETSNVEVGHAIGNVDDFFVTPKGSYVLLSMSDTGSGMDEQTKARLFEPFFTTKEMGKGTGLGLPTVYGIVKQSGGYIWVDTIPGEGSKFRIYLPRIVDAKPVTIEPQHLPTANSRSNETVLIVEDDETVRSIAARTLKRQGYKILEAGDGNQAVVVAESYDGRIDLLLCDAVMPGMGGAAVVSALLKTRPEMKTVYMSGYTDDEIIGRAIGTDGIPFIAKPFSPDELATTVRSALDSE